MRLPAYAPYSSRNSSCARDHHSQLIHTVCTRNVGATSPDRFPGKSNLQIWFYELVIGLLRAGDHHPKAAFEFSKRSPQNDTERRFCRERVSDKFFGVRTLDSIQ